MNPELFRWARETSGLSIEQASQALALKNVEKLQAIEAGDEEPTRPLLLRMAKQYRRPLVAFYLPVPPRKGDRGQDFRTLAQGRAVEDDALLDVLIRDVKARQSAVRSLTEEDDEAKPLPFIGSKTMNDGAVAVLASIVTTLGIATTEYRAQRTSEDAFRYLREKAEAAGVYVLLIGNLGSRHSAISVQSFRGFAIADNLAPFVIINDQDAKIAWSFTLLHELAHLWLGTTGVSGTNNEKAIERFCNEVASRFLLPQRELNELVISDNTPIDEAIAQLSRFAVARYVSRAMVAYALLRADRLSQAGWIALDRALQALWQRERADRKARDGQSDDGPSYYVVRRHRLGRALLEFVSRSMSGGALTPVKAAKILGVKPRSVYPLLLPQSSGTRG